MNPLRLFLLFACLLPTLRAQDWAPLFARLQAGTPLFSTFDEARHYPFRVVPVRLTGELRFEPGRGLSLHYLTPEIVTLIVDDRGLLMRDERGRERVAPPDHRAQDTARSLLALMRFDLAALQADFELQGDPSADPWTLVLTPRDADLAASLGTISVTGQADRVNTIVMARSPRQRIEITVTDVTPRAGFTADELARYFR